MRHSSAVLVLAALTPDPAWAEDAAIVDIATQLRHLSIPRRGSFAGAGDPVPFPRRNTKGVEIMERIPEDPHPLSGSLDLARSASGLRLWTRRRWDDGTEEVNVFSVSGKAAKALPPGAVVQFVDGFSIPAPASLLDAPGRRVSKRSGGRVVTELLLEAWLALPEKRLIYRPKSRKFYPLVPASGDYDPTRARPVQWMVFAKTCPETSTSCVYFGAPQDVCRRVTDEMLDAGEYWIFPQCPP